MDILNRAVDQLNGAIKLESNLLQAQDTFIRESQWSENCD